MQKLYHLLILFLLPIISNAATFYVSNSGDDSNSGLTQTAAWRTIDKVNSMMVSFKPGDQILFARGDKFYGMVEITESGEQDNPIIFGAYGSGDLPEIRATSILYTWTHVEGTLWQSVGCSDCQLITQLIDNGDNQPISREPNNTFLTYEGASSYSLVDNDSPYPSGTFNGGRASVRTSRWTTDAVTIESQNGGTLIFEDNLTYDYNAGFGYFFLNHRNAIDIDGEWAHDADNGIVYYQSYFDPNGRVIEVSKYESCFYLSDSSNFITIRDLKLVGGRTYNLRGKGCRNITIKDCEVLFSGGNGIHLHECPSCVIDNNIVFESNNNAIDANECPDLICTNNTIKSAAANSGQGWNGNGQYIGIKFYNAANGVIRHNNLDSIGYSGIQFYKARNTSIDSNFINHACLVNDDGGAIYGWQNSVTPGNYIRNNIILNPIGAPGGTNEDIHDAHGIYIDDGGENLLIENNTIFNAKLGLFLHNSRDVKVYGNTIFDNHRQIAMFKRGGFAVIDCDLKRNKLVCRQYYEGDNIQWSLHQRYVDMGTNTFDSNYYINPFNPKPIYYYTDAVQYEFSANEWKEYDGGPNGKGTPITFAESGVENPDDLYFFDYNATKSPKYVTLDDTYMNLDGDIISGTIEVPSYGSVILMRTSVELLDAAATPTGQNNFCPTNESMIYTTSGSPSATDYEWRLSPDAAGTISGDGKSATVTWNETYFGDATIYFLATGAGDYKAISPKLYVNILPLPEVTEEINGENELTRNSVNTTYSINELEDVLDYHWTIIPAIAGELNPDWNTVEVDWNNDYIGSVQILVSADNDCGTGPDSEPLQIIISETDPTFGVKKAFTPNFDGINDLWDLPFVNDYPEATIQIYDRNNNLVIEYTGTDPGWNGGDSTGALVPRGNYLYIIDLKNGTKPLVGYVSVIH